MRKLHHLIFSQCLALALLLFVAHTTEAQDYTTSNKKAIKAFESGQSDLYQGKTSSAIKSFEQAVQLDPNFCEANLMLAEWYQDAGNADLSKQYYYAAVKSNATFFTPAWLQLGDMELTAGNNEKARDNYQTFLRLDTKNKDRHEAAQHGLDCATFRLNAVANPVPFTPQNLGTGVNTANDEYLPALTADGKTLVFTRRFPRKATTTANTSEEEDFYESRWQDNRWTHAVRMSEPVNSNDNEGAQCISRDGRIMIFTACGRPDGGGRCDLYICMRHGDRWTEPRNMGPIINSGAWESQPSLSMDGNTLYFISDRKGGYGGTDIWMSTLQEGVWTEPKNLGPVINTAGNETSPFIHYDNRTLYFASNGLVGMGGSDLFVSRRQPDGSWGKPENLGYPINTDGDESSMIVNADGSYAYFSSDKLGGEGKQDLYRFELPPAARPQAIVYKEATDTLAALKVGETVALQNIFFETGKWTLFETSKVELDRIAELLQKHNTLHVELGGHTDNVGDGKSNQTLSEQRAKAVYDYLILRGVPADRLTYKGYGESKPVADNTTEEGRAANRRTTFTIIKK
jgi:outer membrane protein OmpA-like peptidoglycan-associated protein